MTGVQTCALPILKELSDYHMDAMVDDMQITEDLHMIFDHMMYRVLGENLK